MALISTKKASFLGPSFVLAPERYDPRRSLTANVGCVPLGEIVQIIRKMIQPSDRLGSCLILDTSDAREGIVICRKQQTNDIGSTKKALQLGDVIISRLRPYLRQVAYVDDGIPNLDGAKLLCSTEFFVLRSINRQSIAFLVPFLLSKQVQEVLAASQEGGHHPRFDESALITLPVSANAIDKRDEASAAIENAAQLYRESEQIIDDLVRVSNHDLSTSHS